MYSDPGCSFYWTLDKTFSVSSTIFQECSHENGGAICIAEYHSAKVMFCSFERCHADSWGGAIYLSESDASKFVGVGLHFEQCRSRFYSCFRIESCGSDQQSAVFGCMTFNQNLHQYATTFAFCNGTPAARLINTTNNDFDRSTTTPVRGSTISLQSCLSADVIFLNARNNSGIHTIFVTLVEKATIASSNIIQCGFPVSSNSEIDQGQANTVYTRCVLLENNWQLLLYTGSVTYVDCVIDAPSFTTFQTVDNCRVDGTLVVWKNEPCTIFHTDHFSNKDRHYAFFDMVIFMVHCAFASLSG